MDSLPGIFAVALFIVACFQFKILRNAHYITHRPKLRVRKVVVPVLVETFRGTTKSGSPYTYEVANLGGSAARLTSANVRLIPRNSARIMIHQEEIPKTSWMNLSRFLAVKPAV